MEAKSLQGLESLALEDPTSRPLALLQIEALRVASDPVWDEAASALEQRPFDPAIPALNEREITVDSKELAQLATHLFRTLEVPAVLDSGSTPVTISEESALALIEAMIEWDDGVLQQVATDLGIDPAVLATVGNCATLPLLLAIGRRLSPEQNVKSEWQPGYCPVCGSWPTLAEARGLERQQWLRCGRCSTAWRTGHQRCIYCDNTDHQQLGYMAPEAERESRRAVICEQCKGYLKVFATVSPYQIAEILHQDLASLELDIAAIDEGYTRPERPGFQIKVELVPRQRTNGRWFPWR